MLLVYFKNVLSFIYCRKLMEDIIHVTKHTQKSFGVVNPFTGSGARSTPLSVDRIRDKVNDLAL
jgi:hypothetical protein